MVNFFTREIAKAASTIPEYVAYPVPDLTFSLMGNTTGFILTKNHFQPNVIIYNNAFGAQKTSLTLLTISNTFQTLTPQTT